MKIGIACDHGAVEYKTEIIAMLVEQGHEVIDCGCDGKESVDYPDYGYKCAKLVQSGEVEKGIVMCGTGIGIGISANKVKGIRCGLCFDTTMARLTREHNDANMLAVGQRTTGIEVVKDIVNTFLATPFSNGERHIKRIEKLMAIEEMEG
ncbi:ribose 5-phosphate isomerase B [Erysipelotrichaceae bacterium 66-17]|nr:ribose 5-phosphate isomerase B [Erysipelotrichaceae bacterium]